MPTCDDCERDFVEEYLYENHRVAVHTDSSALQYTSNGQHRAEGTVGDSIFADDRDPKDSERREVVRIDGEAGTGFQSNRTTDYNKVSDTGPGEEVRQISDRLAGVKKVGSPDDLADSDDSPEEQQYLMQAWQAMALYLASVDSEDQQAAMQVLKMISNLMSADSSGPNQPQPTGAFGAVSTAQLDAASTTYSCAKCERSFPTESGLISHLKSMHTGGK